MIILELTKDMIDFSLKSGKKCVYYNEDYVLLYKKMPVKDEQLLEYFRRMERAFELGINTPIVDDYYLIPNSDNLGVSKGVFLEKRAKGNVLNVRGLFLYLNKSYDFREIATNYLESIQKYLVELEKRSKASQEMYDKLVADFIMFENVDLVPDANSLNFLFDEENGFSIIDPCLIEDAPVTYKNYFKFIMNGVYGVGRPVIHLKGGEFYHFYDLPFKEREQIMKISLIINSKIVKAFKNYGFNDEYCKNELLKNSYRYEVTENILSEDEFINCLSQWYMDIKEKTTTHINHF